LSKIDVYLAVFFEFAKLLKIWETQIISFAIITKALF
jgi:hypothetical protein